VFGQVGGAPAARERSPVRDLSFAELIVPGPGGHVVSAKARRLNGASVSIRGYMARMESQPDGVFYLCARPVASGEGGGGTADLPVDTLQVIVPRLRGKQLAWVPGPLEVTGRLELGRASEGEAPGGFVTLRLDSDTVRAAGAAPGATVVHDDTKPSSR
jgi:hypothetical protein